MRLSDVATVSSGMTVRERLSLQPKGVLAIQMADISEDGSVQPSLLARVDHANPRYFVAPGDILFRSRGQTTIAWRVPGNLPEPVVAVLPLFIIRPSADNYDSDFLAWWLNQPDAQTHLRRAAQGQTIQMVAKATLETVPLVLPSLAEQRLIADAARLASHEAQLMHRLADCQHTLRKTQLTAAALSGQTHPKAGPA
ncbi:hypothetical protein QK290_05835 [Pseudarthrobacter sp. AL07]|uniref:hypothetical protein n=1 Tax=unclassified Pseudarthrobacter TaxID=2647000 RepID=UPI00249BCFBC|nr:MULTISPECIES: hypothetical protein [unclassified Pseudarthrobacter]MDI3193992.1 hypothetical protein [Pseudarthrobacter sp. AL20]MDI3208047.1 hypothetical protein [Pseudarthrobacter sp. AL07]